MQMVAMVLCCQDLDEHGCLEACTRLRSCVYLQYDNDRCFLCINAAADVTAEGGLTSTTARQQRTLVKRGIEDVIFTSRDCRQDVKSNGQSSTFDQNTSEGNLARIRFCSTGRDDWIDKVCGFGLHFGTESQVNAGCVDPVWDVMPDFVLAEREAVLSVEACFQYVHGFNVVHTVKLLTNLRSFGPVGTDVGGDCVSYRSVGYDLTGIYGRFGHGIVSLGTHFSRC